MVVFGKSELFTLNNSLYEYYKYYYTLSTFALKGISKYLENSVNKKHPLNIHIYMYRGSIRG